MIPLYECNPEHHARRAINLLLDISVEMMKLELRSRPWRFWSNQGWNTTPRVRHLRRRRH